MSYVQFASSPLPALIIFIIMVLCIVFKMKRGDFDKGDDPCEGKEKQKGYILPADKTKWTREDYEIDFIQRESGKKKETGK